MKHYVCGFMKDANGYVALVRKNKPAWQDGRLNGIGGGVEIGEFPLAAMVREWKEETGHTHTAWTRFATLAYPETVVDFFKATVDVLPALPPTNDIGERLEKHPYEFAVRYPDMIQNLKWLIPLAFEDPDGLCVANSYANDNVASGFVSVNSVRAFHGLPPLPATQVAA